MFEKTDLFTNFKNILPGDSLTEEIELKNNFNDFDFIKLYLRAVSHSESENPLATSVKETETAVSANDFLSKLSLKVYNGDSVIFSASPDEADGLFENTFLGTLKLNELKTLRAELSVPKDLSNDYMNRAGEVDWIFLVEGFNEKEFTTANTGFFTREKVPELLIDFSPLLVTLFLSTIFLVLKFKQK